MQRNSSLNSYPCAVGSAPVNGAESSTKLSPEWLMDPKGPPMPGVSRPQARAWRIHSTFVPESMCDPCWCRSHCAGGSPPGRRPACGRTRVQAGPAKRAVPPRRARRGSRAAAGRRRAPGGLTTTTPTPSRARRRAGAGTAAPASARGGRPPSPISGAPMTAGGPTPLLRSRARRCLPVGCVGDLKLAGSGRMAGHPNR